MNETPDELAVLLEPVADRVARRHWWRLPPAAASFDDLRQVCWLAVLRAARDPNFDHAIPLDAYAEVCADRAARRFARVERRRGLAVRGRRSGKFRDDGCPPVTGLDDADPDPDDRHPGGAWVRDHRGEWPDPRAVLAELVGRPGVKPDALDAAFLVAAHGMSQEQVAELWGVGREHVMQLLRSLRDFLRGES